ncbi:small integral membrane protein 5 isoform X1 [Delphinapterus leucas]|uniref:Small integral membrane protein 5 isoform X1 n=2 Tax=Delphinapterus leucas TaxID=9749 RepID=A0A2Y9PR15_DELLE|nr:small integral membrane protein 5 isoform X1 [Delphinapterus leucas]XP_022445313.1 small integral membrane protein 5 isoform X1 [Delphinapterus leucas]
MGRAGPQGGSPLEQRPHARGRAGSQVRRRGLERMTFKAALRTLRCDGGARSDRPHRPQPPGGECAWLRDEAEAGVGERADSLEAAPWGLQVLSLLCSSGGTPAGTRHNMAASNLALEMRSIGERLLYKLQTLPQAEPVEIVAFSVLVIFTATVLLLLLMAVGYCCCQCCRPKRGGRRALVGPTTPP